MIGLTAAMLGFASLSAIVSTDQRGGRPAFPATFQGRWAPNLLECRALNGQYRIITAAHIEGFEFHGRALAVSAIRRHRTPQGESAQTVIATVAWEFEGEPETNRLRLSRAGNRVMMSNADDRSEAEHWEIEYIRCPGGAGR